MEAPWCKRSNLAAGGEHQGGQHLFAMPPTYQRVADAVFRQMFLYCKSWCHPLWPLLDVPGNHLQPAWASLRWTGKGVSPN